MSTDGHGGADEAGTGSEMPTGRDRVRLEMPTGRDQVKQSLRFVSTFVPRPLLLALVQPSKEEGWEGLGLVC